MPEDTWYNEWRRNLPDFSDGDWSDEDIRRVLERIERHDRAARWMECRFGRDLLALECHLIGNEN